MRNFILITFLFLTIQLWAQDDSKPELIGDRPDQTESAFVLPKGYFQFEDGFIFENENERVQNITYSSMLLRYGLFKNFELRFATEYNKVKTSLHEFNGFGPLTLGAKIHVNDEQGWIPQVAFLGHINLSKTGNTEFMQEYLSSQMVLTFNHTMSEFWSVGYSIGAEFSIDDMNTTGTYTLVSGFALTDKVGAFVEIYGDFSKGTYADNKVNGGVTYLVHPSLQLDLAGGMGLSENSAANYFTAGFIYLFKL